MPYLTVDVNGTTIDVQVTDMYLEFADTAHLLMAHATSDKSVEYFKFDPHLVSSSGYYVLADDPSLTLSLVENSPIRVVVQIKGNFYKTIGTAYLGSATNQVTYTFYVYEDRMTIDISYDTSDTSVSLDDSNFHALIQHSPLAGITATDDNFWGDATSETDAGSFDDVSTTANYMRVTDASDYDILSIVLDEGGHTVHQRFNGVGTIHQAWKGVLVLNGVDTYSAIFIWDHTITWDAAGRQALGIQYKDQIIS